MLLGDFFTYTIVDTKDGECNVRVSLNKKHAIYSGHFPQVPILPGVCQVQILKETLSNILKIDLQMDNAKEIKFLSMLNPTECDSFQITASYEKTADNFLKVNAIFFEGERKFLKCKADYRIKTISFGEDFKKHKCCVIIPTYNNATKIDAVIKDVLNYTHDVIVVNDGSTDNTSEILKQYPQVSKVEYVKNKGKGHALKTGFKHALELGFEYAITIDSDGQHFAKDLPTFLNEIEANPKTILIGTRQLSQTSNVPSKNSFANKFSNFWYKIETGCTLLDTQSGYRLYPLLPLKNTRFFSNKYEFELEVLVRSSWKGIDTKPVAIDVDYPEDRITHFRPFKDFFRISVLNTILVTLALSYYRPIGIIRKYKKKKLKQIIKEDIFGSNSPNHIIALSIGFGVFMGIVPIWGYQLAVGFFLAHLFKLNKAIFFLAANISIPPFLPFILYLSFVTGGYVLGHGTWAVDFTFSMIKSNLLQYIVGSIALAISAGSLFALASYSVLKFTKTNR